MRPRVLLDCDGILSDFVGSYLKLLEHHTGLVATPEQVTAFDIAASLDLSPEQSSRMKRAIGDAHGFARNLAVYPGAREGVAKLHRIAEVYIVTSPWNSNPTWTHDREWWLATHFGIPHSRVVHTSAKHLVRGDVLVDDKTSTLVEWSAEHTYGKAIQWTTPHNRADEWDGWATSSWADLCRMVDAWANPIAVSSREAVLR